ncbi:hypothetical protein [Kingella kingae]|nr:hypothetical protein [Kingella kingae]MBD3614267.1 hypothetical protein [Kingella kingae]MBD3632698.1 hypothetical protein [Kingella kingae]MBD3658913.1 hypothetical protein [Kingella kingae]MDK4547164.1 hypothetical protein [Kingella kingae]MDK4623025.1 hypothetical protein [Kingella kingae]
MFDLNDLDDLSTSYKQACPENTSVVWIVDEKAACTFCKPNIKIRKFIVD